MEKKKYLDFFSFHFRLFIVQTVESATSTRICECKMLDMKAVNDSTIYKCVIKDIDENGVPDDSWPLKVSCCGLYARNYSANSILIDF